MGTDLGEDCLNLNVWAPGSARAGANLPVIVYIYGGGNTIGSSGMAIYGGESVAAETTSAIQRHGT